MNVHFLKALNSELGRISTVQIAKKDTPEPFLGYLYAEPNINLETFNQSKF